MPVLIGLFFLSLVVFIALYFIERRSIFISLFALNIFIWTVVSVISTGILESNEIVRLLAIAVTMVLLLILLSGPVVLLLTLYLNGFQILKREGFCFRNFLSIGLAVGLTFYFFIAPFVVRSLSDISFFNMLFIYVGFLVSYAIFISILYTISSFINLINLFSGKLDYVVVLGAGLIGDKVTPLLASRIDKGIAIYQKHSGSKLIMSGGQGADELIPEGQAMANYAMEQGVAAEDIIIESQSINTEENLKFSQTLMKKDSRFALVTNYYHVFRALLLARKLKMKCIGYGAKTKFYFSLNAFIREFVGYLVMSRNVHIIFLGIVSVIYLLGMVVSLMY
ncbi:YdcF family protein [Streptococcus ruminantium]|uniref:YdcF family protein n=1 Tax=Streptococcus ruminantium TaxID=1917441 RepID=UPI001F2C67CC|nr:YdcF family protein [Streptococcus ruminantium]BDD38670.1 membrane protein [Streptococcus ruminantium]